MVDLSGTWRAAEAGHSPRDDHHHPDFDDSSWAETAVPGHWRSDPAFAQTDGPVVYRTTFDDPGRFGPGAAPDADLADEGGDEVARRTWLVLDGVFYTSDVWLDGAYLGDTEGYFFPHQFEITDTLADRSEHALAVEVACPRPTDPRAKRNLTGVFQHWDLLDQDWTPGGIWRPVHLQQSGPVRIRHWRARCQEVTDQSATVAVRVVLDTREAGTVELVTTVAPHLEGDPAPAPGHRRLDGYEHRRTQSIAAGENRVEWTLAVGNPQRWWPWTLGDQPLYDVVVEVRTETGSTSDRASRRIGLRTVEMADWVTSVNGERLFLKGANQGPTRMALAEATPTEMAADIALARDAGLDFLRLHAHVARPELYQAADEAGMLLWQDLPLQWGYARGVKGQARRQAREAVDLLAHHPSVFLWCGHNEPLPVDTEPDPTRDPRRRRLRVARELASQALPTWNRSLLDRAVKSVLERNDGTRPVVAHSGVYPHFPQLDGTDSHLWFGWKVADQRDLPAFLARWPRMARFVSEFGAAAVPDSDEFIDRARWPDLDWEGLARHHGLDLSVFERYVPPEAFDTYEDWRAATQRYQARLLRYQIESLRRLKYRPTGGFAQFSFADSSPAVSPAVLDHRRRPKAGFDALRTACQPVIVVLDRPPDHVHPGDQLDLDVHIVSDARISYSDMVVHIDLSWKGEVGRSWSWEGDIPADECVRVGHLKIEVPDTTDDLVIDVELAGEGPGYSVQYGTHVLRHG